MKQMFLAAATALTLSGAAAQAEEPNRPTLDFGRVAGEFTVRGYGQNKAYNQMLPPEEGRIKERQLIATEGSSTAFRYDDLGACLEAAGELYQSYEDYDLFSDFDIAVRAVCRAERTISMTAYWGSERAIEQLKAELTPR